MRENLSVFNLKCLNCIGNLQISENISEFACQYCGASQIVLRKGGIVTLELISDKIERVQNSVNTTSAELEIQRLNSEIKDLEAIYLKLETSLSEMKSKINPIAITIIVFVCLPFILSATYTGSIIPIIPGGIIGIILIGLWRKKISSLDSEFFQSTKNLDKRTEEIVDEISDLRRNIEYT